MVGYPEAIVRATTSLRKPSFSRRIKRITLPQVCDIEREATELAASLSALEDLPIERAKSFERFEPPADFSAVLIEEVCLLNPRTVGKRERVYDINGQTPELWPYMNEAPCVCPFRAGPPKLAAFAHCGQWCGGRVGLSAGIGRSGPRSNRAWTASG